MQQEHLQKFYSRYINKLIKCNEHSAKTLVFLIANCPVLPEQSLRQMDIITVHSQNTNSIHSCDLRNSGKFMLLNWLAPGIGPEHEDGENTQNIFSPYQTLEHSNPRLVSVILLAMSVEPTRKKFIDLIDFLDNIGNECNFALQNRNKATFEDFIKELETLTLETALILPAAQRLNNAIDDRRKMVDIDVRDVENMRRKVYDVYLIGHSDRILELLNMNENAIQFSSTVDNSDSVNNLINKKCQLAFGQMKILAHFIDIEGSTSQSKSKAITSRVSSVFQNLLMSTITISSKFVEDRLDSTRLLNEVDSASELFKDWSLLIDESLKCRATFTTVLVSATKAMKELSQTVSKALMQIFEFQLRQNVLQHQKRNNIEKKVQKQSTEYEYDLDDDIGFIDDTNSRNLDSDATDSMELHDYKPADYTDATITEKLLRCIKECFLVLCKVYQFLRLFTPTKEQIDSNGSDWSNVSSNDLRSLEMLTIEGLQKFISTFTDELHIKSVLRITFDSLNTLCIVPVNPGADKKLDFEALHQIICLLLEVAKQTISPKKFEYHAMSDLMHALKCIAPHLDQRGVEDDTSNKKNFLSFLKRIVMLQKNADYQRYSISLQLQLVDLFSVIAQEDPHQNWAKWSGAYYNICSQADRECTIGSDEETGVASSILRFINHSSQKIRLRAANALIRMFSVDRDFMDKPILQQKKREFAGLHAVLMHVVQVEFNEGISPVFVKDETLNRIGTVMSSLAPIAMACPYLERETIVGMILLHKSANVNIGALKIILTQLAEYHLNLQRPEMKKANILSKYLEPNLGFLLKEYFDQGYSLDEFPYQLFGLDTLQNFVSNYENTVAPMFLWCCSTGQEENCLKELSRLMPNKKNAQEIISNNFASIHSLYVPIIAAKSIQPEILALPGGRVIDLAKTESLDALLTEKLPDTTFQTLMNETMPEILAKVLKQVYDPEKLANEQGIGALLIKPNPPSTNESLIMNVFDYYDTKLPEKVPLFSFLSSDNLVPDCLQRIIMEICEPWKTATISKEFSLQIQALHGLKLFIRRLSKEVLEAQENTSLDRQLPFLTWFMSVTLKDLIVKYWMKRSGDKNKDTLFLISLASENVHSVFATILSMRNKNVSYKIMERIAVPIANSIINFIMKGNTKSSERADSVATELVQKWLRILNLIVIDFKKQFEDADKILMYLDPFPETHNGIFDKLQQTLKNEAVRIDTADKSEGSLLSVIVRFVKNDPVTRRVESLEQLFKGLKNNRQEIATMLQKMNEGRGFSEEASKSILHQLITNLLEVSFSKGIIKCIQNV